MAKHFGLEMNWWYDGRRDVVASTEAALEYLVRSHNRFDDWTHAIAAYNSGGGRVSSAVVVVMVVAAALVVVVMLVVMVEIEG